MAKPKPRPRIGDGTSVTGERRPTNAEDMPPRDDRNDAELESYEQPPRRSDIERPAPVDPDAETIPQR